MAQFRAGQGYRSIGGFGIPDIGDQLFRWLVAGPYVPATCTQVLSGMEPVVEIRLSIFPLGPVEKVSAWVRA